ncbi:MAG: exodeoxyribonuclease III [Ignavibacteriae bacterium HGW-Ignavibacteriae-3]|nr:MAG: exodeoxyribonuclease III [Ignavibacteriae bacterium HGW-Ignavibacteriae-3]
MRLLSWNVNGIRAAEKKGLVGWIVKEDPDILCLQETKARPEQLSDDLLNINGYKSYFSSSVVKKGYSGVAIYTKEKPVKVEHGFGIPKFDDEGRIIIAEYKKFVLINIYYPNGKAREERLKYKMDFYDAFLNYAENLKSNDKKLVICGDVNTAHKEIDLARPKENEKVSGFLPIEREWLDKFFSHGYHDTFRMFNQEPEQYTWWDQVTFARDRNVGWRIDYFFVSDNFKKNIKDAFILQEVMGSDHCPVGIEMEV